MISEEGFDILQMAVRLAKMHQIRAVEDLRVLLLERYPGKEKEISEALVVWADQLYKSEM